MTSATEFGSNADPFRPSLRKITIGDFGPRGRGVLAIADVAEGELIERSPVLIIPNADRGRCDDTIIFTYVFMWENNSCEEDLYRHEGRAAIALGYTSLLSHSPRPNCNFVRHIDAFYIDVFANRDIRAGEELTIDYQMTLWFTPTPL